MSASRLFTPEPERFEFTAPPAHKFSLARRDFFQLLGAGIAIFSATNLLSQETAPGSKSFHNEELPQDIAGWLHIGEDGSVTGFTGKVEIGQNIRTSLAQTVADELRVPFDSVKIVTADTLLTPFDAGTFGSRSTPTMTPELRRAACAARELLLHEAAKRWRVAPAGLIAADAKITDPSSGQSATYAELAKGQSLAHVLAANDAITKAEQWTVAGKPLPKVHARPFVTGAHQYTPDLHPAGLWHGKILRAPSFGATVATYDDTAAKSKPDVVLVHDGNFIGAAAPTVQQAEDALQSLKVEWSETAQISNRELFGYLKKNAVAASDKSRAMKQGSLEDGYSRAAHKLEGAYTVEYIAHAPLEPRAALAQWSPDGRLTVRTGTQRPFAVRDELASVFHVPENRVRVIVPDMGSAYGGKHTSDAALEATRLAKASGHPVKIVWTRQEEFTWAYFRPAGLMEIKSAIDQQGKLTAWEFDNYHAGTSGIDTPYAVANRRVEYHEVPLILRSGSYRGLAATANHFARETHMDELARLAKMDPLEFRLMNLENQRLRAVLQAAANSFGWPANKTFDGQGFGLALGEEKGSYVAACAEVVVDARGNVKVTRVTEAFECGAIVNPDGLRNQVAGAVIQGLGGALFEAVQFENGRIKNSRFASYRVPRFRDIPNIEVVLLDRKDIGSAGAGETPIMAIAPAIGNAIFSATGKRLTALPLAPKALTA